ncbi:MAG: hypothetical protein NTW23_03025 [Rhodoluna sp.]|nr:hypothetical protein [Rhodoluna sp.]
MSNYQKEFGRESSLPTWGFVLAFLLPPVGAIIGHISLGQMRSGEISAINRNISSAAVIVGWVMTAVIICLIPLLLFILGLLSFFGSLTYY